MEGWTDRQRDGWTDQQMDKASYRVACPQLKIQQPLHSAATGDKIGDWASSHSAATFEKKLR